MRLTANLSRLAAVALALASLANAHRRTAALYIQPVSASAPAPALLAEVAYDADPAASSVEDAEVTAFEYPDLSPDVSTVRVGLYNPSTKSWVSSTSLASVDNFAKGYAPNLVLSTSPQGEVISAAVRGVRIDAGQTRDFGPKVVLVRTERGAQPELNKPVVLTPDGRKMGEEGEKTFFQKYWWVLAIALVLTLTGGGGEGGK